MVTRMEICKDPTFSSVDNAVVLAHITGSPTLSRVVNTVSAMCGRTPSRVFTVKTKTFRRVFGDTYNSRSVSIALKRMVLWGVVDEVRPESGLPLHYRVDRVRFTQWATDPHGGDGAR